MTILLFPVFEKPYNDYRRAQSPKGTLHLHSAKQFIPETLILKIRKVLEESHGTEISRDKLFNKQNFHWAYETGQSFIFLKDEMFPLSCSNSNFG
jgi:hypothetical protein